jgi:hypothetical protein
LQEELRIRHGSGAFGKWLIQLAKTDVLVLDTWGMEAIDNTTRSDLLEIIDDHAANKATILTSQLPIEHWHAWISDATIADAIIDRIMQRNHRLTLTGDSLRQENQKPLKGEIYRPIVTDDITIQARNTTRCAPVTFNRNERSSSPVYAISVKLEVLAHANCRFRLRMGKACARKNSSFSYFFRTLSAPK